MSLFLGTPYHHKMIWYIISELIQPDSFAMHRELSPLMTEPRRSGAATNTY